MAEWIRHLIAKGMYGVPGAVLLWVNKVLDLIRFVPQLGLPEWRADADGIAAGVGTALVFVLVAVLSLVAKPWRALVTVVALIVTAIAVWRCLVIFTILDTTRMPDTEAKLLQASWENWYIAMQWAFVAAITSALMLIGRGDGGGDEDAAEDTAA